MSAPIVLAYAAGDSGAVRSLAGDRGAAVATVTLDLGQRSSLEGLRARALAEGAARAHVIDCRDQFVREFVMPAMQAGVLGAGCGPRLRALARAAITRRLVEVARIEGASAIAHGAADDASRQEFDALARGLGWTHEVVAVRRAAVSAPPAAADEYLFAAPARESPEETVAVEIAFDRGVPISINGVDMPLVDLIQSLETIAHAPAVRALDLAHAALRERVSPGTDAAATAAQYAALLSTGQWFSAPRRSLDAGLARVEASVRGAVPLTIQRGECRVDAIAGARRHA